MAWETRRGNGRYYTRSRWQGGKVVRQYVGTGPDAERAAAEDEARRAQERARRDADNAEIERLDAADAALAGLERAAGLAARAMLVAAGYHQHKRGEWRRRRDVADC
jgi:hypothetical protein